MNVCFNRAIRRVFKYKDYESIRDIMFGCKILPMDLYLIKVKLCFIGNAFRSNKVLLNRCAILCRSFDEYINIFQMNGSECNLLKVIL